ncbi:DedA family protein [Photobacterium leiognathi subsp. mandapamensis]|uniref:DedA family protein n=1 Tax=Photobacterium leiognathi TaxID=553611 RepID=UPI003AF39C8B
MVINFEQVIVNILNQDITALSTTDSSFWIYFIIAAFIGLESALLPAAPLPCDSIIILAGSLSALGIVDGGLMLLLLIIIATIGSWFAFYQGNLLKNNAISQKWIEKISQDKREFAERLLNRNELLAMFLARFIPIIRTLLPLTIGALDTNKKAGFLCISFFSAIMWISLLMGGGYLVHQLPENISRILTVGLVVLPIISVIITLVSSIIFFIHQKMHSTLKNNRE